VESKYLSLNSVNQSSQHAARFKALIPKDAVRGLRDELLIAADGEHGNALAR